MFPLINNFQALAGAQERHRRQVRDQLLKKQTQRDMEEGFQSSAVSMINMMVQSSSLIDTAKIDQKNSQRVLVRPRWK